MAAHTRAPDDLPQHVDITRSSIAYGDRALPKINGELNGGDLITQQRALFSLCDLLRSPQNVKPAIDSGVLRSMQQLLAHADDTVRLKATEAYFHLASHAVGRRAIADSGSLLPLAKVFDDASVSVRLNAHGAVERSTQSPSSGASVLVGGGVVAKLVEKIQSDSDEIKLPALGTLCHVLSVDVVAALTAHAVTVLVGLLSHTHAEVAERAARAIMLINVSPDGKDKAVEEGAVPALVTLLKSPAAHTRAAGAQALMSLSNSREGKNAALVADAPAALIALLDDQDDAVKMNAIKAITTLTEHPLARQQFLAAVSRLKELGTCSSSGHDPASIARFANQAVEGITWTP